MQRILFALGVSLLGARILCAQTQSPEEVLKHAVEKSKQIFLTRGCDFSTKRTDYDKDGRGKLMPRDESDSEAVHNLSIPALFRQGRFHLLFGKGQKLPEGTEAIVISFYPKPKKERLRALRGESDSYTQAMNAMAGEAVIDPATLEFYKVTGKLVEHTPAKWEGIRFGSVTYAKFHFEQKREWFNWLPQEFNATIVVDPFIPFVENAWRKYEASFTCSKTP